MAGSKERDPLDPYRRVRKPVPRPGRAIADRRRKLEEERARREAEQEDEDQDQDP